MQPKPLIILAGAFFLMGLITLGALILYEPENTGPPLPVLGKAPEFKLTDSSGQTFDSARLDGKVWVADFFFSSCGGPCPTMAKHMGVLQQNHQGNKKVQLVNITVDPETDTPEKLNLYAKKLNADTSQWHFLTGPKEEIGRLVDKDGFRLASAEMLLSHSTRFVLVDRKGNVRGFYEGTEKEEVESLSEDIGRLLSE
ncbi:MAG: SCO family protein [Acidobacteriota bacterium]|nr:SCO family protein [Acidobacteriota bacterium]